MPRAGLTTESVIARGAEMLEERGGELTLGALAADVGVKTPSLYRHVDGLPGLKRGIMLRAKRQFGAALGAAVMGRSRSDAVRAIAIAYRQWALAHPAQYLLATRAPLPGDDEDAEASAVALDVVYSVLAGFRVTGDDAVDATRFLRAALHGFVALESGGAFALPRDLDHSFDQVIAFVIAPLEKHEMSLESPQI